MPKLAFERYVPHSPEHMYELVSDLEAYPRFLPYCSDMDVKQDRGKPADVRYARMTVQFGPIQQAYTSRVTLDPVTRTIAANAVDGPFRHLDSVWTFTPDGEGTHIRFAIDFQIANPLLRAVAEPAFAAKQDEIIAAFADEADRRYRRR